VTTVLATAELLAFFAGLYALPPVTIPRHGRRRKRRAVRCDICGERAYPLRWGGLMHASRGGTLSVHAAHYIRSMFGQRVYRPAAEK
jgi:hypothetical protein